MCNKCDKNNYPLKIEVNKSVIIEIEYKREAILKLIPKLDFDALSATVI
jgi:multifunctional methyltransferase subunit TRM112